MADFFASIAALPALDKVHRAVWALMRNEVSWETVADALVDPLLVQVKEILVRKEQGLTPHESVFATMGENFEQCFPLLSDEAMKEIVSVLYRTQYVENPDERKPEWTAFLEALFKCLDPKGLTKRTPRKGRARLGQVWTEEAALCVLRINRLLDPPQDLYGQACRIVDHLDALDEALRRAPRVAERSNEAILDYIVRLEPGGPHCILCMIRELSSLPPERHEAIRRAVDAHVTSCEAA